MSPRLPLALCLLALGGLSSAGCSFIGPQPVPGSVTGTVLYNGQPGGGLNVSLTPDGTTVLQTVSTDASGRYYFTGVSAGTLHVMFLGTSDKACSAADPTTCVRPNTVASWHTQTFDGSKGAILPAFDVSYDGLLFPDNGTSWSVSATAPIPFHWSTSPSGARYRLNLVGSAGYTWSSDWTSRPTTNFAAAITPGSYKWWVDIDGGNRGVGETVRQDVDF